MDPGAAQALAVMTDPKDLSALLKRSGDPAAAKAVAQQFGALLMQGLWQQNDGSAIGIADGVGGGIVNSMFAGTMGQVAMQGDRLGLADLLLRSMEQKQHQQANPDGTAGAAAAAAGAAAAAVPASSGFPLAAYWQANGMRPLPGAMNPPAATPATANAPAPRGFSLAAYWQEGGMRPPGGLGGAVTQTAMIVPPALRRPAPVSPPAAGGAPISLLPPASGNSGADGATPQQIAAFGTRLAPLLRQAAGQLGVSPRILLAQAAIETGWGRSIVGNNLFGVKAGASWSGAPVAAATHEDFAGRSVATEASFRAYPSLAASVQDFVALVSASPRYRAALGKGEDAAGYAEALVAGGWATDADYVQKLATVAASSRAAAPFAPLPLVPPDFATVPL